MGCCGCNNKSSAVTAGIFGLIQSFVGLTLDAFFINLYTVYPYDQRWEDVAERLFLVYATINQKSVILLLLSLAIILHGTWFISSVVLLIGNASNNAFRIRQWVVCTVVVIFGDIVLPIVFAATTIQPFLDVVASIQKESGGRTHHSSVERSEGLFIKQRPFVASLDLYKYYIILLICFVKLGPVSIIVNICLNVFTNRRATEITSPPGYVLDSPTWIIDGHPIVPNTIQVGAGTIESQPPILYTVCLPQNSQAKQQFTRTVPSQLPVGFPWRPSVNDSHLESHGHEDICTAQTQYLIPPKGRDDHQTI